MWSDVAAGTTHAVARALLGLSLAEPRRTPRPSQTGHPTPPCPSHRRRPLTTRSAGHGLGQEQARALHTGGRAAGCNPDTTWVPCPPSGGQPSVGACEARAGGSLGGQEQLLARGHSRQGRLPALGTHVAPRREAGRTPVAPSPWRFRPPGRRPGLPAPGTAPRPPAPLSAMLLPPPVPSLVESGAGLSSHSAPSSLLRCGPQAHASGSAKGSPCAVCAPGQG